jgi:hypothetical protein
MTALLADSTLARPALPPCPMQAPAAPGWLELWASLHLTHPRVGEALAFAQAAGVDPLDLTAIQIGPKRAPYSLPRLSFGDRVFSPAGEVTS